MDKNFDPDNEKLINEVVQESGGTGGMLVGQRHSENGIKAFNSGTGQPLEMEGGEVVITRPAVADKTKREFEGQMMTNREILSKINESGGGVSFADGGDIPTKINITDRQIEIDGNKTTDVLFAQSLGYNSTLKKGGQIFTENNKSYNIEKAYKLIHDGRIDHELKDIEPFPVKNRVLNKEFPKNRLFPLYIPQGLMIKTDSGDLLIDGNHRLNRTHEQGFKKFRVYYITDPNAIKMFSK